MLFIEIAATFLVFCWSFCMHAMRTQSKFLEEIFLKFFKIDLFDLKINLQRHPR